MLRRLPWVAIAVLLGVGLAINIAVAWACADRSAVVVAPDQARKWKELDPGIAWTKGALGPAWFDGAAIGVAWYEGAQKGVQVELSEGFGVEIANLTRWSRTTDTADMELAAQRAAAGRPPRNIGGGRIDRAEALRSGWPFFALVSAEPGEDHALAIDRGKRWLPLRPIVVGFVANTAIYAGALAPFVWVVAHGRRKLRVARGRCERCGYRLEGLARVELPAPSELDATVCPECAWPTLRKRSA